MIDIAEDCGADFVKFQLFPNLKEFIDTPFGKNAWLSPDIYLELKNHVTKAKKRVRLIASVFGQSELDFYVSTNPEYIKFGYSQKDKTNWFSALCERGEKLIVSTDTMHRPSLFKHVNITKLYCISEYPVKYEIAFDEIFPTFDGFSDHTLGYQQTLRAVEMGAEWIEKHIKLEYADVTCPDSYFALNAKEAKEMCQKIRAIR